VVFVRDRGGSFAAPIDAVWEFVGSGDHHSQAHGHTGARRVPHSDRSGTYSWEQPFDGSTARFTMRWTSFWPVGIGYDVLEGPFAGSRFFLLYEPQGERTGVEIVGEFVSPTLPVEAIPAAVERFFAREFEQDSRAIERDRAAKRP
jgi:hypothetical protein